MNEIDISKCKYLEYELEEDGNYYYFCKIAPKGTDEQCHNFKDCYYKQLQQLKQENEKLSTQNYYLDIANLGLAEENEGLQSLNDFNVQKIETLEAENEELKKQVRFKNQFRDYAHKYKQCLDEIEEYIYTDCEYNDGCDRNICIRCKYSNVHDKRILELIKQAKEGNNE